ncbi:MAG: phosphodiester glycosidase family protein [Limnothrix sp.]
MQSKSISKSPKKTKRWWKISGVSVLLLILAAGFGVRSLRPAVTEDWQPLYQGIDLLVRPIPDRLGKGRMMAVRVKWNESGVEMQHRQPDFPLPEKPLEQSVGDRLFRLEIADWALQRQNPAIFVNTTRYEPPQIWRSIPGNPVSTLETLVIDGQASHRHEHSYLLWWDQAGEARLETQKPPSLESLQTAVLGIGVQGVSISQGQANRGAMSGFADPIPRTFMGIDNDNKTLYLIAFEEITDAGMVEMAIALGVQDGAMVDSGDATHLLIGKNAKELKAHTGVRNRRPLAGYLLIFAEPLE